MMKKISALLVLLGQIVFAHATVDERMTDVYFANGIDTSREQALDAKEILERKYYETDPDGYKLVANWKVAVNNTSGMAIDLYEASIQELYRRINEDEDYQAGTAAAYILAKMGRLPGFGTIAKGVVSLVGKQVVKDELKEYMLEGVKSQLARRGITLTASEVAYLADTFFEEMLQAAIDSEIEDIEANLQADIDTQREAYMTSIKEGHGVTVVAHSQGNFFINFWYAGYSNGLSAAPEWAKQYIHVLGVATPAGFVAGDGPHITFDNDIIQIVPGSLSPNVDNPTRYYFTGNAVDGRIETLLSKDAHNFLTSYMATPATRNAILGFIDNAISVQYDAPSQWGVKETTGACSADGCNKRWNLKHLYDDDMQSIVGVYPFFELGKLYPVSIAGMYVKAKTGGTGITTLEDHATLCYRLEGTGEEIPRAGQIPEFSSGSITVDLVWGDPSLNLDLSVEGPIAGALENKDGSCPLEHFFIAGEPEPGTYVVKVHLNGSSGVVETPIGAKATVRAGNKQEIVVLSADSGAGLDVGPIAEIIVSEHEVQTQVLSSSSSSVSVSSQGSGRASGAMPVQSVYSSLVYEIIVLVEQLYYGPIKEARLELYALNDYATEASPLYSGNTSSGDEVHTAGRIAIPYSLIGSLDDERLYILRAEGGADIDADDDGVTDLLPRQNNGVMHGIFTGRMLKNGGYKMNLLTELAYRATEEMFTNSSAQEIVERINAIVPRMLVENIDRNESIGFSDLMYWLPTLDKEKLSVNYNTTLEPIVQKIYNGEEIRGDVYRLLYYPEADAGEKIFVDEYSTVVLDGSGSYDINGEIVEYHWQEGNTTLCRGSEPICEIENPGIGIYTMTLEVVDDDNDSRSDEVNVLVGAYAPHADAGNDQTIFAAGSYTLNGSGSYDSNGEVTTYRWTEGEVVWCDTTEPLCDVNLSEVRDYQFKLTVIDNDGHSSTDSMQIIYPYKPVADAGADLNVSVGEDVFLDGSASTDEDGYIVEYLWERDGVEICRGSDAECSTQISDAGTYTYHLTVSDDYGATGEDSLTLRASYEDGMVIGETADLGYIPYAPVLSESGDVLFVASSTGVHAFDVSDVENMIEIGSYTSGMPTQLFRYGTYLYKLTEGTGFDIVDITDATNPVRVGGYTSGGARDMAINQQATFAVMPDLLIDGFRLFDVSDPTNIQVLSEVNLVTDYEIYPSIGSYISVELASDDQLLYLTVDIYLCVFDLQDPSNPTLITSQILEDEDGNMREVRDAALSDDESTLFILHQSEGGGRSTRVLSSYTFDAVTTAEETASVSTPNATYLYRPDKNGVLNILTNSSLLVVDSEAMAVEKEIALEGSAQGMDISPDAMKVFLPMTSNVIQVISLTQ